MFKSHTIILQTNKLIDSVYPWFSAISTQNVNGQYKMQLNSHVIMMIIPQVQRKCLHDYGLVLFPTVFPRFSSPENTNGNILVDRFDELYGNEEKQFFRETVKVHGRYVSSSSPEHFLFDSIKNREIDDYYKYNDHDEFERG